MSNQDQEMKDEEAGAGENVGIPTNKHEITEDLLRQKIG